MWDIIVGILGILITIYVWLTWNYDYWKKNGIPEIKATFPFGSMKDLLLMRKHIGEVYADFYWKYPNEPAVGVYKISKPQLVLRDTDLIKTVCVKEFNSFHDNEFEVDPNLDPVLALNPFSAKGDEWKALRSFHSQNQSSGKIKGMFTLMLDVCKDMLCFLQQNEDKPIEAKYFSGQYTTDVVASSVYGLKTNSFLDPEAEFRKMSAKLFEQNFYVTVYFLILNFVPKLVKILRLRFMSKKVSNFFVKVVADLCEYRKTNKVSRPDFLQTMLDENLKSDKPKYTFEEIAAHTMTFFLDGYETSSTLMAYGIYLLSLHPEYQQKIRDEIKEEGQISYEGIHTFKYLDAVVNEYTFEEIAAHTMTFFLDGYETSSTLMAYGIYLLSLHPEYQQKIRDEIKEEGQISYEGIHTFKYLDAVVNETLRMYPPGLVLTRLCTKDITLKAGEKNYPITKGMTIAMPIYALHHDSAVFPEPEQYVPERFYEKQAPAAFLPFGMGPRACLGSRFALTQVKTGIAYLVQNFRIFPRDSDGKLPTIDKHSPFLMPPKTGLWVKFESIKDNSN